MAEIKNQPSEIDMNEETEVIEEAGGITDPEITEEVKEVKKKKKGISKADLLELGKDKSGLVIKDMDLSGVDFRSSDFSKCEFENVKLDGANLQGCDFTDSKQKNVSIDGADLRWSLGGIFNV